MSDGSKITVET